MGRPSKYKEEFAKQAKKLCELGATDRDMAEAFEVHVDTIQQWKVTHKSFSDSLRLGKTSADARVEAALYHRAIGYSHPETDIRVVGNELVMTELIKHYPPDTKAALAWLYNRKSDEWSPVPNGEGAPDLSDILAKLISKLPN